MKTSSLYLTTILLLLLFLPGIGFAAKTSLHLPSQLVHNGGYMVSQGTTVLAQSHADQLFTTASTVKLLTALAVLDTLGEDYRFTTQFFQDKAGILYIRGSGDPFLTSEYISQIFMALHAKGVRTISGYVLDDTIFELEQALPPGSENSDNPYDAPNGGLAVNFNSLPIVKQKDGTIGSGESQTPLLFLTKEIGHYLTPGKYRVNINHYPLRGAIAPQLRYTAELLHALALRAGINSQLMIRRGRPPQNLAPIFTFISPRTVKENVKSCLYYSSNFMANQLLLHAATQRYGPPATWKKGQRLLNDYATRQVGLVQGSYLFHEGSGLSRNNRMTPEAMQKILQKFVSHIDLLPKKRGARIKSGTMDAVYCYAGYLPQYSPPIIFTFLLNQPQNTRDRLLVALKKALRNSQNTQ